MNREYGRTTLRPGLLVMLHTQIRGGVKYTRVDLDADKASGDRAVVERWETTKVTEDPEEHARAVKVRNKCGSLIRSVCIQTAFGLLCPLSKEAELNEAIKEAQARAEAHNTSAPTTTIGLYVLKGYLVESDTEAMRAMGNELREMMDTIQEAVTEADVEKIRTTVNRAKAIGAMLDEDTGGKINNMIEEARKVAREITKKLTAKASDVGEYVQTIKLKALEEARFAFLDMEAPVAVSDDVLVKTETQRAAGLDMDDTVAEGTAPNGAARGQLDLEVV